MHRIEKLDVAVRILGKRGFNLLRSLRVRIIQIIHCAVIQRNTGSTRECRRESHSSTSAAIGYDLIVVFQRILSRLQERKLDRIIAYFYMRKHVFRFFGELTDLFIIILPIKSSGLNNKILKSRVRNFLTQIEAIVFYDILMLAIHRFSDVENTSFLCSFEICEDLRMRNRICIVFTELQSLRYNEVSDLILQLQTFLNFFDC